ncbi:MAG: branched-chain amino acid ABC transporter permease [Dehalococcoidia bacterium]|nr:MAG: branched-chain amino acid ABC transporter permease [Dehalococcoidia bacterium]
MEQILIQGALLSGLYALIALGFTMIFGVGGVLNLAHAGYVMVAGYMFYMATYILGLPLAAGFAIAISVSSGLAVMTYMAWVRRFLYNPVVVFVSTLILALLLEHIMTLAFFRENINVPPIVAGNIQILGYSFSNNLIVALIASWICIAIVLLFVRRTHMGRAMRALAMDRRGAIISGINPDVVNLTTWAISGALAGVAGIFYGSYTFLVPDMWVLPLIMSFAIVVIGGLGSIEGTLVGAHIVGFMETATVLAISDKLRSVPGLVIMIIVLVLRPRGLFGR